MAANRKGRAREAQLAFEALSIEGGLLSPEWLSRVAQLQAGMQAEADYHIPKGLNLRDEIGRYWRIAQAHWIDFTSSRVVDGDPRATSERFLLALLREALGFASLVAVAPTVLGERRYPIGQAALGGRVPVVIAPADSGLDVLASTFGDGNRKRSAFGLAQEYLNAQEGALWGIASDGSTLRIVRDNASLTRPAWIEADLQRIFTEERYADFAALWLLCHETRFGREGQPVTECALEFWRNAGRDEGTRAREHLRRGVEEALVALGQGFLAHADNYPLRAALQNGTLSAKDYFNQLLRLVYRLIFLLTVEERGLLHPDGTHDAVKALYAQGYSLRRLRERSVKRSAHDRFPDIWEAIKIVFCGLATGESRLGLPALAGIFAPNQCRALDAAKLENRALLLAVFKLAWLRDERSSLSRVNWRDMGPEELGSVYESLLELVPQITTDGRQFAFATGGETKGNARKTTGSYYTPESLVQVLLDSALEPVVFGTIAKNPGNPVEALLSLSIVDPACGSGHFLLAAARRLAAHVARLQANGTPSASDYRHALRQIVGHCIFGVDLNPMAVELCKVGLWMEAVEPGLPLTFLNSHIQHGNALLGAPPELMTKGVPDAAWDPIEGDDKTTAGALKKRNKAEAGGQRTLDFGGLRNSESESQAVARAIIELDAASDANVEALANKEKRWDGILSLVEYRHQKLVADAWCAAFVWPKQQGGLADAAPTNELWRRLREGQGELPQLTTKTIGELADQYRFFHWHLQFPQVFAKGGFDVVLGNPPWDRPKPEPSKYFAAIRPDIAAAPTSAARDRLISALAGEDPRIFAEWRAYERQVLGAVHFLTQSGASPLSAVGKFNLGNSFLEAARRLLSMRGRAGVLNVSGLATDDSGKDFISDLLRSNTLISFYDFENRNKLFPGVDSRYKFSAVTVAGSSLPADTEADFVFFAHDATDLASQDRHIRFSAEDIRLLNPISGNCPIFRERSQAELVRKIYCQAQLRSPPAQVLWDWEAEPTFLFVMSDHSDLFVTREDLGRYEFDLDSITPVTNGLRCLPLYEAKMFHQFDHRWATLATDGEQENFTELMHADASRPALPRYWMHENDAARKLQELPHNWLIALREVTNSTNERTVIAAILPKYPVGHNAQVLRVKEPGYIAACLLANLNSVALDFAARTKVGGSHLSSFILRQLPLLASAMFSKSCPWSLSDPIWRWVLPRVLELSFVAWDLQPFARDVGYDGPPFRWSQERRFLIRCELDAAFFHLYGLSRNEAEYVMEAFPIVRKNDEVAYGEYRTKRIILEMYGALTKAAQTGIPYRTRLDPLPGAPGATHGVFTPDGTPKDYAEALRSGLLYTLIRRSGEAGIAQGTLSRALVWLEDPKNAASWLGDSAIADFKRVRESDPLLAQGFSEAPKLLEALENEKAITRDANGIVRPRAGNVIPNWLPQTPTLAKLASVMRTGLERAEQGVPAVSAVEGAPVGTTKRA